MLNDDDYILQLRIPSESIFQDKTLLTYNPELPIDPIPYENPTLIHSNIECNNENNNCSLHTTNIMCWWDCHKIEGQIYRLPIQIIDDNIQCIGYFCSPSCAYSYNFECGHKFGVSKWQNIELLQHIYGKVIPAPPRESLIQFGGKWSIDRFRNNIYPVKTLYPPMYLIKATYENNVEQEQNQKYVAIDPTKVAIAEKQLKLSRTELKHNRENMSLDMFISIKKNNL